MDLKLSLIAWTARAAFVVYVAAISIRWSGWGHPQRWRVVRWLWSAGCAILFVHVALAFAFVHHWSHSAAYQATERETAAVVGMKSGVGIYFNYAMLVAWFLHVARLWTAKLWTPNTVTDHRATLATWCLHLFLGFMWFNATVVFGQGPVRWIGLASSALLLAIACWASSRNAKRSAETSAVSDGSGRI